jgi:hypothetical protein
VTPEGVADIQLVNLVAAPFSLQLSLEPNRGRQVSGNTSQDTCLMLAEWLNLSDALVIFKRSTDALYSICGLQDCTVQPFTNVPYLSVLLYLTFP